MHVFRIALLALALTAHAAPPTVAELEALPVGQRQTTLHHHRLARAHQAAGHPGAAAEALATAGILPPGQPVDQQALRTWLAAQAPIAWASAQTARAANDTTGAIKAYLIAVHCDPALARRDDPVRALALTTLAARVQAKPDAGELRYQRARLLYLTGDRSGAEAELRAHAAHDPDPYRAWRSRTWADHFKTEADGEAAMAAANAAAASAGPAPVADAKARRRDPRPDHHRDRNPRLEEIDRRLIVLNSRISMLANPGRYASITEGGKRKTVRGNDSRVTAELEELKSERDELLRERGNLDVETRAPGTPDNPDRLEQIRRRLATIGYDERDLEGTGYVYIFEGGQSKKFSKKDPRAQERREALAAERKALENERTILTQNQPAEPSYVPPPVSDPPPVPDPPSDAPSDPPAEAPDNDGAKAKLDSEIRNLDWEIERLSEDTRDSRPVKDDAGVIRWLKPSDSRYQTYLESLKEKRKKLQQEHDLLQ